MKIRCIFFFFLLLQFNPSKAQYTVTFESNHAVYSGSEVITSENPARIKAKVKKKSEILQLGSCDQGTLGVQFVISKIGAGSTAYEQFNAWFYIRKKKSWEVLAVTKNIKIKGSPQWSETFIYKPKTEAQWLEISYTVKIEAE